MKKIVFFQIAKKIDTVIKITKTTKIHLLNKKKLLFIVENEKAAKYLDDLLWKTPAFSFVPHKISDTFSDELIVITTNKKNINNSNNIFNLTSTILTDMNAKIIYEFDYSLPNEKKGLSNQKFKIYKENGFQIESL